ncbi:MAG: response regulator transcription factor [Anaerolineales bacterium]|nr:response regulator transcription factor [Anaerolineales bacterium]
MKALIVDDDRVLADVVAFTLRREGFEVIQAHDGQAGLQRWRDDQPDLIVLDVNMPKMDGFEVCRQIRSESDIPILLLTVRGEEDDIVAGLEIGADDYIVKPFSPRQLVARARAILRRAGSAPVPAELRCGELVYQPSLREVRLGTSGASSTDPVPLAPLEARLLECLLLNAGQVLTFDLIIDHVWGPHGADRDMLRQLVHRLRTKIEDDPANPTYIQTVPGLGYGVLM